jgi:ketosteroid isomerase-like protein
VSSNSELLRVGYEAWNHDDLDAYLSLLHPDVRIVTSGVFPDLAPEYVGRDRAERFWRQMHEPWEFFRVDVEHIEDQDDWAIASLRFRARGVDSGVEVDMRFGMAMRVQEGLAIEFLNRRTFDEARTAVRSAQPEERRART